MRIILDTNALMVPVQFGVDIFSELATLNFDECIVPSGVVHELEQIASGAGANRNAARVALSLLTRCETIDRKGNVDNAILKLAIEMDVAVFTNDSELKKRLRDCGVSIVYLRQRSYLVKVP